MIEIEVTWVATKQCRAEANRKLLPHEASTHLLTFDPIVRYLYPFQQCLKWLPYVAGAMVLVLLLFATYVRTVPPKAAKVQPPVDAPNTTTATPLTMDPVLQQQQREEAVWVLRLRGLRPLDLWLTQESEQKRLGRMIQAW